MRILFSQLVPSSRNVPRPRASYSRGCVRRSLSGVYLLLHVRVSYSLISVRSLSFCGAFFVICCSWPSFVSLLYTPVVGG